MISLNLSLRSVPPLRLGLIPELVALIGSLFLAVGALAFDALWWELRPQGNKNVK
jgi:hypothetical protein